MDNHTVNSQNKWHVLNHIDNERNHIVIFVVVWIYLFHYLLDNAYVIFWNSNFECVLFTIVQVSKIYCSPINATHRTLFLASYWYDQYPVWCCFSLYYYYLKLIYHLAIVKYNLLLFLTLLLVHCMIFLFNISWWIQNLRLSLSQLLPISMFPLLVSIWSMLIASWCCYCLYCIIVQRHGAMPNLIFRCILF